MGSRATEPQVYMAWEWTSNALVPFLPFRLVNTWYQSSDVLQACPGKKCHSGVRTQQSSPFLNLTSRLHFLNFPPPLDSLPFMFFLFFFCFFSYFVHWFTVCSSVCVFFFIWPTMPEIIQSIHWLTACLISSVMFTITVHGHLLCPRPCRGGGGIRRSSASVVRPSVRPSVCLSDVAYIGSNSKTKRPRKTKLCTGVPQVTCDSQTDFKVKRSKVNVGRGHIVAAT